MDNSILKPIDSILSPIDAAIVAAYLIAVLALGLCVSRGMKTSRDFFLAGRSLPWWAVALSLVVTDIGAKDMVGLAGDAYRYGIVMMNFDFIGCSFAVLLAAFLFMPFFWVAGIYTIPEYLGRRYNLSVRTFFAVVWTVFMMLMLGTIFASAAAMFKVLLGWDFWLSVALTAIVVALYTAAGGLKAVVVTDVFSCIVLILGAALIVILGLEKAGGWTAVREAVDRLDWTAHHFKLAPPPDHPELPWPAVFLGLSMVLGPAYWIGNQAIVQRDFGTRSQGEARAAYVLCAAIKMLFPLLLVIPGIIALALFHKELGSPFLGDLSKPDEEWSGNTVLPHLIRELLPSGVLGIVIGAFLAGVMSNLDSYVNSATTMVVTDIYKPFVNPEATDRQCLRLGRALTFIFVAGGVGSSYVVEHGFRSVFEAFQTFLSFFQGPLLTLLLLGMLWRRTTQWGGLAGMVSGVLAATALKAFLGLPYLWLAWWSFVAAFLAAVGISLVTKPHDTERLRGLVCWIPIEEARE